MQQTLAKKILSIAGGIEITHSELIQPLWSNYGELLRVSLEGSKHTSVIVKHISLPNRDTHPRGWNTDLSQQRKLKSYKVETAWYQGFGQKTDTECKTPEFIGFSKKGNERILVMEDLNTSGFPLRKQEVSIHEMQACLYWLAHFHSKFMGSQPTDLWEKGSYWHLDTRPDEWHTMSNVRLKNAAKTIDQELSRATFQTIIHGDAKLANFCFAEDGFKVAAVDFQYVGKGCGVKDVAYFLSSCLHEEALDAHAGKLLQYYFESLQEGLDRYHQDFDKQALVEEWERLYPYAWADFYRFLDGWSPGHWKVHGYSKM
ncbi:MAG: oxidoreductase family protein, partial [Bacteroidota bacterium]